MGGATPPVTLPQTCEDIPLSGQAQVWLDDLARETGSAAIAGLSGAQLLGERAMLNKFLTPGMVSAGGGCRLYPARNGFVALNLARADDRELLPALFTDNALASDGYDTNAITTRIGACDAATLVAHGRDLGLAIARTGETPAPPAVTALTTRATFPPPTHRPLVLDLSALWAGPLAGHLLWLAGASVVKLESPRRADAMRNGDPQMFARLNQGKASVSLDITTPDGRTALISLIARADIVIEAARPRALAQLGVDADMFVRERRDRPLVWLMITGHGALDPAAQWVGFGDDCGVAGGLTDALIAATGQAGFVGDAIADPLTGIRAAREGWRAWREGHCCRIGLAMSGVVAEALAGERTRAPERLAADLSNWAARPGQPFPTMPDRPVAGELRPFGADTAQWLTGQRQC